ncbi:unnamed protein product [Hermetia illucens]|uniref:Uncharacterized protein n=1 Tax=Hermetia illucens TaxID=343691 RepID=A0A7R8UAK6_HERIL|nr:unnamed protein product [Hermetia illucens]
MVKRIVNERNRNSEILEFSIRYSTIPHSDNHENSEQEGELNMSSTSHDSDFKEKDDRPYKLTQLESSDLNQDLDLSQEEAELVRARLQQWNHLQNYARVSMYRKRQRGLLPFFWKNLICCCDINCLMDNLNLEHNPTE